MRPCYSNCGKREERNLGKKLFFVSRNGEQMRRDIPSVLVLVFHNTDTRNTDTQVDDAGYREEDVLQY